MFLFSFQALTLNVILTILSLVIWHVELFHVDVMYDNDVLEFIDAAAAATATATATATETTLMTSTSY